MTYENFSKFSNELYCEKCDYQAKRKSDFNKHLKSKKHNTYKHIINTYKCSCGKEFKHRQSLYNHKKVCNSINNTEHIKEMINMVI